MAYPQELINEVLDYLDSGHSVREAERRFGVGHESAARWRRLRDGNLRANRPHPVKYPQDTVRLALGLAYGGHGFGLDEVAVMVCLRAHDINWRRYVEGGHMDIPEIVPTRSST
ncbi:MAG: IS630 transposase-related protein [Eggerthellaceae bacterium]